LTSTGIPERDIALMRTDDNASPGAGGASASQGAMPIAAACIALVGRRGGLAVRAITTLVVGLGAAALAAPVLTFALDLLGLIPANFEVGELDKVWGALAVLVVNEAPHAVARII
jgi:hypothetical protein